MKKILALSVALVLMVAIFAGCGSNTVTINVYNWGQYIDKEVNKQFTKETGIKVKYTNYDSNEIMYAKLKTGGAQYDVIFPSDYMVGKLINENMLEKLDYNNIPSFAGVDSEFKNLEYDPQNEYTVPYMWGTVGIIYNTKYVKKIVDSWNVLWDSDYSGKILMFDNPRDALGIALKKLGYSYNTTDKNQLQAAYEQMKMQKPLLQDYVMDQIFEKMISGEAYIAPYYAGDFITMKEDNPDLAFVVPKEGSNMFVDAMCIPKGSKNKAAAEAYINFMTRADISAQNAETIGYSTPVSAAKQLLPDEMKNSSVIYPDSSLLKRTEVFKDLPDQTNDLYTELWTQLKGIGK